MINRLGRARDAIPRRAGLPSYATIYENDTYRPLTLDQVVSLFAPLRTQLIAHRAAARKLGKMAEHYSDIGEIDEAAVLAMATAEPTAKQTLDEANAIFDTLFFETDSATARWWRLVEDIDGTHAEIEEAISSINDTRQSIADGDYE
jgi:alkylation response protein AidB-like acyl-CoA dehydrogenase